MELPKLTRKAKEREREAKAVAEAPMSRLQERREELREKFTQLQWDLGGAAYEMAARDYFRLDVLARMAARLQTVDAELAEIERMARLEGAGAAGSCPGCGSLYAQGAAFCWRCGRNIHATGNDVVSPAAIPPTSAAANGYSTGPVDTSPRPVTGHHAPHGETPAHYPEVDRPMHDGPSGPGFDPSQPVRDAFVEMDLGPPPSAAGNPASDWHGLEEQQPPEDGR